MRRVVLMVLMAFAVVGVAGCATSKQVPAPASASGPVQYCMPCTNPCFPCVPAKPSPTPTATPTARPDPCAPGQAHTPEQCPALDDDNDGIPNGQDKCPLVAGIKENNGCPPVDTDGDGVPDHLDKCPSQAGTAEFQGCPAPKSAKLEAGKITVLENVFFDTGKAGIQARSNAVLDDVATVLKAHPEVTRVVIGGHTDNQGNAKKNRKLSLDRAEAVKA